MNNWRLTSLRFRTRLIIYISLLIAATMFISTLINYHTQKKLFIEQLQAEAKRMNEEQLKRVDLQHAEIAKLSNSIVFHPYVEHILNRDQKQNSDQYQLYLDHQELKTLTSQIYVDHPHLLSMYLFDRDGINRNDNAFSIVPDKQLQALYYELSEQLHDRDTIIWMKAEFTNEQTVFPVLLHARWMRSRDFETYGLLLFVFRESLFAEHLQHKEVPNQYLLYNNNNELLVSRIVDEPLQPILTSDNAALQLPIPEQYMTVNSVSRTSLLQLVQIVSLDDLQQLSNKLIRNNLLSVAIAICIAALFISWFSKKLVEPLQQLMQGMQQLRRGNLDIRLHAATGNEFDTIKTSFNSTMDYIDELLHEVSTRKVSERDAVLTALQAQLNPHFLYNTLGSIYWKLYMEKEEETADLVFKLSELLRYCLEPIEKPTSFADEMTQTNNYLYIQTIRFDQLQVEYELDPATLSIAMTRFLLQPIIENIFNHAFANKSSDLQITIRSQLKDDYFFIEIIDNGCGMTPELVTQLNNRHFTTKQHIGIQNVQQRIELVHGYPYGITIRSELDQYTAVQLKLPYHSTRSEEQWLTS